MKKLVICLIFFCGFLKSQEKNLGNLVLQNIPEIPNELSSKLRSYQEFRSATLLSFQPETGKMLISTRFGETNQLHTIQNPMGARKQITFFKEPVSGASYCPDKTINGLVFSKDEGGNEFNQLYWMDLVSGNIKIISAGGKSQNNGTLWSNGGRKFIYSGTARNRKDYDLYLAEVTADGAQAGKLLLEVTGSWTALDWSPDDKKIIIRENISVTKAKIFMLDLLSKKIDEIHPVAEDIAYSSVQFSKDGKGIFMCSDEGTEFQTLKYLDLSTGKMRAISHSLHWDVSNFKMNKQRDKIAFCVNENGIDKLYLMGTVDMKYMQLDGLPHGVLSAYEFNPSGSDLGISLSTAQSPGDVYTVNLNTKSILKWTESETGGLDITHFPKAELIQYPSFDEVNGVARMIPAFVYRPYTISQKYPVIISIHGGPEGQSRPAFNAFYSFLATELGAVIVVPNVRGSTGYGKTYVKLDNEYLREDAVKDIGKLIDWVTSRQELDASRIAVIGGSYGGYMSLACMVHFNKKLKCGVDIVGISNFVTFLKNTEDYRKDLRRVEYGDERNEKMNSFLQKISPLNHVDSISKPIFIVQGANDPRVPATEAIQMKNKLSDKGNEVWFMMAQDEGHGFRKKSNIDYFQNSAALFFSKYLIGDTTSNSTK